MEPTINPQIVSFLNESNRIEGITEIDYHLKTFQNPEKGHFGAYVISNRAALENQPLTVRMIRTWQGLLGKEQRDFTGDYIPDEEIGRTRGPSLQKNVRIGKHIPPSYDEVPTHLQNLVEDINESLRNNLDVYRKDDASFTKFAAASFLRFERIHPFGDGNGRTGRLLANYIAAYSGRPLIVFPSEMILRNRYISAHESEEAMAKYFTERLQN